MKIILVPDEGEWVLVPKVATDEMLRRSANLYGDWIVEMAARYEELLAAAPPCRVVELPERNGVDFGWNACLDEIERRAKTLA